ncbi:MAG: hypothetical protein WAN43_01970 [Rhodomicrobium sp.]
MSFSKFIVASMAAARAANLEEVASICPYMALLKGMKRSLPDDGSAKDRNARRLSRQGFRGHGAALAPGEPMPLLTPRASLTGGRRRLTLLGSFGKKVHFAVFRYRKSRVKVKYL